MSESADYITDAMAVLGTGYDGAIEIHQPETYLKSTKEGLQEFQTGAWIKLTTTFRNVMSSLKGSRLSVFLCICLHINNENNCYPSVDTIADETGYSRREVINAVQELEKIGFLTVKRGEMKSNLYHVNVAVAIGAENAPVHFSTKQVHSEAESVSKNALKEEPIKKELKKTYTNFSDKTTEHRKRMMMLAERLNASLGTDINFEIQASTKKWWSVCKRLLEREENGQTVEIFAKWYHAQSNYDKPKLYQIARDPSILVESWGAAFPVVISETTPKHTIPDYSGAVANPFTKAKANA